MTVSDSQFEAMRARLSVLETAVAVQAEGQRGIFFRLDKIENVLSRLTWLLVSGIGLGFVAFMLRGGLSVPGI